MDVGAAALEGGIPEDFLMQGDVGLDAVDDAFAQRCLHAANGRASGFGMHDQFADHGVIIGRHPIAIVNMRIHPHPQPAGGVKVADGAGAGHEG